MELKYGRGAKINMHLSFNIVKSTDQQTSDDQDNQYNTKKTQFTC